VAPPQQISMITQGPQALLLQVVQAFP